MQRLKPRSDQEENELVIFHLRQLCDTKQKSHVHIGEVRISVMDSLLSLSLHKGMSHMLTDEINTMHDL